MRRRQRALVTRVHRLEHVERLAPAALADDDAVGAHAEGVHDEIPDRVPALALHVRGASLERDDVGLPEAELRRVLDRDDSLRLRNVAREHVEQRRLAAAGAAGDDDVLARHHRAREKARHAGVERPVRDEVLHRERRRGKLANRDARAADGERPDDRVDARAVLEARVDERRRLVDPPPEGRHDTLDDGSHALVVGEAGARLDDAPSRLDVDRARVDDHDLGHRRVGEEALERPEAQRLVGQLSEEGVPVDTARNAIGHRREDRPEAGEDARPGRRVVELSSLVLRQVQEVEETPVDLAAERAVGFDRASSRRLAASRAAAGSAAAAGRRGRRRRRRAGRMTSAVVPTTIGVPWATSASSPRRTRVPASVPFDDTSRTLSPPSSGVTRAWLRETRSPRRWTWQASWRPMTNGPLPREALHLACRRPRTGCRRSVPCVSGRSRRPREGPRLAGLGARRRPAASAHRHAWRRFRPSSARRYEARRR